MSRTQTYPWCEIAESGKSSPGPQRETLMKRAFVIPAVCAFSIACATVANTGGAASDTERSLMQADRDFAGATHTRAESTAGCHSTRAMQFAFATAPTW